MPTSWCHPEGKGVVSGPVQRIWLRNVILKFNFWSRILIASILWPGQLFPGVGSERNCFKTCILSPLEKQTLLWKRGYARHIRIGAFGFWEDLSGFFYEIVCPKDMVRSVHFKLFLGAPFSDETLTKPNEYAVRNAIALEISEIRKISLLWTLYFLGVVSWCLPGLTQSDVSSHGHRASKLGRHTHDRAIRRSKCWATKQDVQWLELMPYNVR